ncbi:4-alpha-glucanotransferase [Trinickia dinghuensis]|uniref:4-alpha-glucanotransferase n=1 Tax=Trinickia dinghuensis TaxID=2291023 RepID=A0A3D8JPR0_9BURK|nr:4-alpha-glucanotransferase [Trinickia dinghuensis]RDU95103.1 4-alpha-glucanotransferase [Trinickia dinghuensis]
MTGSRTISSSLGRETIERIATRAGFEVHWEDANKRTHRVKSETLATLLAALGLPCGTADEAKQTLAMLDAEHAAQTLPPLVTAECHRATALPAAACRAGDAYRIELESGGIVEGRLGVPKGESALLAPVAEPGYHMLEIGERRVCLAVAPPRCYTVDDACLAPRASADGKPTRRSNADAPRAASIWGIGAQLYGLRRAGDGGIGDFTALASFARHSAQAGADAVAISPTHAMFSADPRKFSPYAPSSRLFLNVAHIDPSAVLGMQAVEAALDAVATTGTGSPRERWAALEALPLIDWPDALGLRLAVLRALYERFCAHERTAAAPLAREFDTFCSQGGRALEDHARFEAIDAIERASQGVGHWRDWPAALTDPRRPEVEAFAREHRHEVDFHLFLQWLAAKGMTDAQSAARAAGMAIGLVADLAVGCDGAGSHAWSYPDDMLRSVSVGAPPDLFNQAGQAWGLTTFSPRAMRMQGFGAFIDMLRASFAHGGGLRIDHVLGLQRLWLVPEGASAADGAYLRYPMSDLLRLIALESMRHRAIVIGEDLGTVPEGFRERLARHGLLGISVLWFERSEDGGSFKPPAQYSRAALATTTTHDLPTVAGWWSGNDIVWRDRIGQTAPRADGRDPVALANAERAADRHALWRTFQHAGVAAPGVSAPPKDHAPVDEALAFVASTPAPLALYPLEDLLGLPDQPNLPGSIDEHPNWRRRLTAPVDALFDGGVLSDRLLAVSSRRAPVARPRQGPPSKPSRTP